MSLERELEESRRNPRRELVENRRSHHRMIVGLNSCWKRTLVELSNFLRKMRPGEQNSCRWRIEELSNFRLRTEEPNSCSLRSWRKERSNHLKTAKEN